MNTIEKMKNLNDEYFIAFRNILREAEKMDREALDRFRSWSNGMMEPAEDKVYTDAVRECTVRLKKETEVRVR